MPVERFGREIRRIGWHSLQAALLLVLLACGAVGAQSHANLRGRVTDLNAAIITRGTVRLYSIERILTQEIGKSGEFEFKSLAFGKYDLEITVNGFRKTIMRDLGIEKTQPESIAIMLDVCGTHDCREGCHQTGGQVQHDDAKPAGGGRILITTVRSPSGLPGASIRVFDSSGQLRKSGTIGGNASFEATGLLPGRYEVRATLDGHRETTLRNVWVTRENATRATVLLLPAGIVSLGRCEPTS